jgi:hypothetical protein
MAPIPAHTYTSPWESIYVIVGSSAAALTGLQFVVMALVAEVDRRSSHARCSWSPPFCFGGTPMNRCS